ncbi:phosphodiester glycosidase family protein [Halodesulfovibrio sp. MK-HDV]|jgi:phosphodiester glycosidase|uniref:phosphodiester glycosidase family protein n=1 Tax=unclassified Halodesulfovibrio TaxID=2644657 RepID=UPI001371E85A|nr:phosphodiester glycosidase family protein [Halodesulfovibrio sp. MK-HDV]KAF1075558.1 hypothetical protein MKHDV_02007 [Halodesulfovibrio sp. MK-HDV]
MIYYRRITLLVVAAFILVCISTLPLKAEVSWTTVAKGLSLAEIPVENGDLTSAAITALRISPDDYEFMLLMRSKEGDSFTPEQWAARYKLTALINASMYLPDNSKSTGYMRNKEHTNNGFIHNSFGSFFVANPTRKGIPAVDIIDRHQQRHTNLLPNYSIVIQNYRLFSASRTPLWPEKASETSIAAVAKDTIGNIVFIHCRTPMTVRKFTKRLLESQLELVTAMYVEGGPEASMYLKTSKISRTWAGRYIGDFWNTENKQWSLPNVLGIRAKVDR